MKPKIGYKFFAENKLGAELPITGKHRAAELPGHIVIEV
jgi:hypothetical protein